MQIPPTTTLINMANALPVQTVNAAPASAKGPQQPAAAPSSVSSSSETRQQPSGRAAAHRGSIINILV